MEDKDKMMLANEAKAVPNGFARILAEHLDFVVLGLDPQAKMNAQIGKSSSFAEAQSVGQFLNALESLRPGG